MSIYILGFIGLQTIALLWILFNSAFIKPFVISESSTPKPFVSVLIPMRNEERNIEELIHSLQTLSYSSFECILLDDQSSDQTRLLTERAIQNDPRFSLIEGQPLPEGWNGKVHGCHQLSQFAEGDLLLFIDADVRLAPDTIERTISTMAKHDAGMISGFPHYGDRSHLSQLLVTLQHFVVYAHLPTIIANKTKLPSFTAACGGFIAFTKEAYESIGGHASVHSSLLEDVHLARVTKKNGYKMLLVNISPFVTCYMYESIQEAIEGFTKNIFIGINKSKVIAFLLICWYTLMYIVPTPLFVYSIWSGNSMLSLPLLISIAQKVWVDYKNGTLLRYSLFMPLSALLFVFVLARSMYTSITGKAYTWKGRSYS